MITKNIKIGIQTGLDAKPIAMLVQIASQFESRIYVESDSKKFNAKSIMGMMTLGLQSGADLTVTADGSDEDAAIGKIEEFLAIAK